MSDIATLAGELRRHDDDIRDIRKQQETIVSEIKSIGTTVSNVASSLTEMRAQKGPPWHQIISTGTQVVIVIGAIVSGIVYIASNGQSPQQHAIDKRVTGLEWRMDRAETVVKRFEFAAGWKPQVQRD